MMRAVVVAGRLWCGECARGLGFTRLTATAASAQSSGTVDRLSKSPLTKKKNAPATARKKPSKKAIAEISRQNWLDSLTLPLAGEGDVDAECDAEVMAISSSSATSAAVDNAFVIGIDPDFRGALAVLRLEDDRLIPEVFDVPTLKVAIGGTMRLRPDAKAIVNLLQTINAPQGSVAYVENSLPHKSDGKQSWWSSGFGFGMWTGTLLASGISVVPVSPRVWKTAMGLSSSKDESRLIASSWFPSIAAQLTRKKDHGRAEALLLAAFGRGLTPQSEWGQAVPKSV